MPDVATTALARHRKLDTALMDAVGACGGATRVARTLGPDTQEECNALECVVDAALRLALEAKRLQGTARPRAPRDELQDRIAVALRAVELALHVDAPHLEHTRGLVTAAEQVLDAALGGEE